MDQGNGDADGQTRVWYQSFVDPVEQRPYIERLKDNLASVADPGYAPFWPDVELLRRHRENVFRAG